MELYLVRHAVAHKRDVDRWPDDSKRPLTIEGEERFRQAAEGIVGLVPKVGVVLSSPFIRAWQTAEILEQRGWSAPVPCEELEPYCPPHKVLHALLAHHKDEERAALVGHRPGLHELASYLLTGHADGANVRIKKGGMVRLSFEGSPRAEVGYLEWLLAPRALQIVG